MRIGDQNENRAGLKWHWLYHRMSANHVSLVSSSSCPFPKLQSLFCNDGVQLLLVSDSHGELGRSSSSDSLWSIRHSSIPPPPLQVPHAGLQRFPGPPAAPQSLHPQAASQGHYPPPKPAFWNPVTKGNVPWQPQTAERKSLVPHEFQARPVSWLH